MNIHKLFKHKPDVPYKVFDSGILINSSCTKEYGLKNIKDNSVDLVVTSPPYNLGLKYSHWNDNMPWPKYWKWCTKWMNELYRICKPDGRICINHYLSCGNTENRIYPLMKLNHIACEEIGFQHHSVALWTDNTLCKNTAWGCYDDKTKVMTKRGFIYFKNIDIETDIFATIDKQGKMEWQKASNYINHPFKGKLKYIENKSISLAITTDHNILYKTNINDKIKLGKYDDIPKSSMIPKNHEGLKINLPKIKFFILPEISYGKQTKKCYYENDKKIKMNDWLRFLGIFLTDGNVYINNNTYKVSIYQKKKKYLKKLKGLFNRLPFKFTYKKSKYEFYTCNKQLALYLNQFNNKNNRILPSFVYNVSEEQKSIFIRWYFYGDGNFRKGRKNYIAIPSKKMFNSLTILLTELNYKFSYYVKKPIEHEKRIICGKYCNIKKKMYYIHILYSKNTYLNRTKIKDKYYEGNIYCVSVPNKTLLVSRKGLSCWCGNSYLSASCPYVSQPYEGVLILFKEQWKKINKGKSTINKKDFMMGTRGLWNVPPDSERLTLATFSVKLAKLCIDLFSYEGDVILDPFSGSGTTFKASVIKNRYCIGLEISPDYYDVSVNRIKREIKRNWMFRKDNS